MSTPTTQRWRESMYRKVGRRPRPTASPTAPSKISDSLSSSLTSRLATPRRTFIRRARSARDRLMGANGIQSNLPVDFAAGPRRATVKSCGLILRIEYVLSSD